MTINIGGLPIWLAYTFLFLGGFTCGLGFTAIMVYVSEKIKSLKEELVYRHKLKHRLDKPPLAKCYCIDCEDWNKEDRKCRTIGLHTGGNWFCKEATPRDKDSDI